MGKYFTDVYAVIALILVVILLLYIVQSYRKRAKINHWGKRFAVLLVLGLAVCIVAAMRDKYCMPDALFALDGMVSIALCLIGAAIAAVSLLCLILKKQSYRMRFFFVLSALFIAKVLVAEIARLPLL